MGNNYYYLGQLNLINSAREPRHYWLLKVNLSSRSSGHQLISLKNSYIYTTTTFILNILDAVMLLATGFISLFVQSAKILWNFITKSLKKLQNPKVKERQKIFIISYIVLYYIVSYYLLVIIIYLSIMITPNLTCILNIIDLIIRLLIIYQIWQIFYLHYIYYVIYI